MYVCNRIDKENSFNRLWSACTIHLQIILCAEEKNIFVIDTMSSLPLLSEHADVIMKIGLFH